MLTEWSNTVSPYLSDTGWIATRHLSGATVWHYDEALPVIDEPLYVLVDIVPQIGGQTLTGDTLYPQITTNYVQAGNATLTSSNAISPRYWAYGFNSETRTYPTLIQNTGGLSHTNAPLRCAATGQFLMPNGELATALLSTNLDGSGESRVKLVSVTLASNLDFKFRIRTLTLSQAEELNR